MERKANHVLGQILSIQHIVFFLVSDAIVEKQVRFTRESVSNFQTPQTSLPVFNL